MQTSDEWQKGNGAAVVIAESIDRVQNLLSDYELEDDLRCYMSEGEAQADDSAPSRHLWVCAAAFATEEKAERVVVSRWDEK